MPSGRIDRTVHAPSTPEGSMRIESVIFDCDGTLVDSELLANTVLVEYAASFGLRMSVEEAMRRYVGGKMADCVAGIENQLGHKLPETFIPELRARTAAAFRTHLRPVQGARDLLASLRVPFCVASSGPLEKIELSLSITGLAPFFTSERIFSAHEIGFWKPDPRLFLHAARVMGVPPERCAVVEDSLPGVKAGIAAGMPTFWLHPPHDAPESVSALHNLTDLADMLASPQPAAHRLG